MESSYTLILKFKLKEVSNCLVDGSHMAIFNSVWGEVRAAVYRCPTALFLLRIASPLSPARVPQNVPLRSCGLEALAKERRAAPGGRCLCFPICTKSIGSLLPCHSCGKGEGADLKTDSIRILLGSQSRARQKHLRQDRREVSHPACCWHAAL
ncbi:hypothetical protein E2320_021548 [Naja naja]|nr:hypothetical protein E2320_021548 [Naja naja]